jgi:hypothetical protein
MRCEFCGKNAPFFTETYDPMRKRVRTIYLCEEHQEKMYMRIVDAMLHMGSERLNGYKDGTLKVPEATDADKEAIRKVLEANDTAMPIIQARCSIKDTIRDIGEVLAWLYAKGVLLHGMDEHIEELLNNIAKEGGE